MVSAMSALRTCDPRALMATCNKATALVSLLCTGGRGGASRRRLNPDLCQRIVCLTSPLNQSMQMMRPVETPAVEFSDVVSLVAALGHLAGIATALEGGSFQSPEAPQGTVRGSSLAISMSRALESAATSLRGNLDILTEAELISATWGFSVCRLLLQALWESRLPAEIGSVFVEGSTLQNDTPKERSQEGVPSPAPVSEDSVEIILRDLSSMIRAALPSQRPDLALSEAELSDLLQAHGCCLVHLQQWSREGGRASKTLEEGLPLLELHPSILRSGEA